MRWQLQSGLLLIKSENLSYTLVLRCVSLCTLCVCVYNSKTILILSGGLTFSKKLTPVSAEAEGKGCLMFSVYTVHHVYVLLYSVCSTVLCLVNCQGVSRNYSNITYFT